jgi:hypothetical protein
VLRQLSLVTGLALAAGHAALAQPVRMPCCRVVASNARTGVVLARNNASGKTFLFISKNRLLTGVKIGTAVNFTRSGGISVQGATSGFFKLIKPPKPGGGYSVDVDCSLAPEICPGSKPAGKLTMIGVTTWEDVIDYCYDEIAMCVDGPG